MTRANTRNTVKLENKEQEQTQGTLLNLRTKNKSKHKEHC